MLSCSQMQLELSHLIGNGAKCSNNEKNAKKMLKRCNAATGERLSPRRRGSTYSDTARGKRYREQVPCPYLKELIFRSIIYQAQHPQQLLTKICQVSALFNFRPNALQKSLALCQDTCCTLSLSLVYTPQ